MLASDVLTVSKIVSDSVIKLCQTTNSKSELGHVFYWKLPKSVSQTHQTKNICKRSANILDLKSFNLLKQY